SRRRGTRSEARAAGSAADGTRGASATGSPTRIAGRSGAGARAPAGPPLVIETLDACEAAAHTALERCELSVRPGGAASMPRARRVATVATTAVPRDTSTTHGRPGAASAGRAPAAATRQTAIREART